MEIEIEMEKLALGQERDKPLQETHISGLQWKPILLNEKDLFFTEPLIKDVKNTAELKAYNLRFI